MHPILKFIIRHPKYFIIGFLMGLLWVAYEHFIARPAMSYMGVPKVETGTISGSAWSHILRNQGYMLEYSESLANPLWVIYQVSRSQFRSGKRPSNFKTDWRSIASINYKDYTHSGFDRGHLAPNYVITTRYGRFAQLETFLMTNISPQKPTLNQKAWQRLEEVIANDFSKWHGNFWVVTGPIFAKNPKMIKNSEIAIPKAFYKILIKPTSPESPAIALAFIFPQEAKPRASLLDFTTTIDEVEKQTGIDFFANLEDNFEIKLESQITPQPWRLEEVATRPPRY